MEKKYMFLLLDESILKRDKDFLPYDASETNKNAYLALQKAYGRFMYVLKNVEMHLKTMIDGHNQKYKELDDRIKNIERQINDLKRKHDIDDKDILNYIKKYSKQEMGKMAQGKVALLESDKEIIAAVQEINRLGLKKYVLEIVKELNIENMGMYQLAIRRARLIEKIFVESCGFNAAYENGEWHSQEQEFIDKMNLVYQLIVLKSVPNTKKPADEDDAFFTSPAGNGPVSIAQINVKKVFGMDVTQSIEKEFEDDPWLFVYEEMKYVETLKKYIGSDVLNACIADDLEELNNLRECMAKSKKATNDIGEYVEREGIDTIIEALFPEKRKKGETYTAPPKDIREDYFNTIKELYEELRITESSSFIERVFGKTDNERMTRYLDNFEKHIKAYETKEWKKGKAETEEDVLEAKERTKKNMQVKKEAFRNMLNDIKQLDREDKRYSILGTIERLYKKSGVEAKRRNSGDLMEEIEAERLFKEFNKAWDSIMKGNKKLDMEYTGKLTPLNHIYQYEDKAIMTLIFTNTDIEKYKTAAVILDKEDINRIFIYSEKNSWKFNKGLECAHGAYSKKTYKPDRILTSGGRVQLAESIMGKKEDENTEYSFLSHKFDYRKSQLSSDPEVKKENRKNEKDLYYDGKIRIEESGELADYNTVAFNGLNESNKAILYFDDITLFKDFLNKL